MPVAKKKAAPPRRRPASQDHLPKKKTAQQREAEATDVATVEWRGESFEILTDIAQMPAEVMLAFEDEKAMTAVRAMLGDEQWARLARKKPTVADVMELFERIAEALGFEGSGESSASSD